MKKDWKIVLLLGIIISLVGYKYRIRQYDQIPFISQNFDEYGYLWLGKSLLSTGIPANWSALNFYNQYQQSNNDQVIGYNINVDTKSPSPGNWNTFKKPVVKSFEGTFDNNYKSQFLIVQPYLDNPPLTGIIFALVDSGKSMAFSTLKQIRIVPIVVLSATIITIFLLGYYLLNFKVGFISALIYCLGPSFIISSRMAVPENLIAAILPLSLLILFFYRKTHQKRFLIAVWLLCFISTWLKVSGLIIPLSLAIICFNAKYYRTGWIITSSAVSSFLGYVIYCYLYSPVLFNQIITTQSTRMFNGPALILSKIFHPQVPSSFYDGWIILGYISFLAIILLSRKVKNLNFLSSSIFGFLIFFMIFGGINFPWYQFIIYPILALSIGTIINHFLVHPRIEFNLLFFITVVSTLLHYSQYTPNWITYLNSYRILLVIFVLFSTFSWFFHKSGKIILRTSLVFMVIFAFFIGIKIVNNLNYLWPLMTENRIEIY